eukprot:12383_1
MDFERVHRDARPADSSTVNKLSAALSTGAFRCISLSDGIYRLTFTSDKTYEFHTHATVTGKIVTCSATGSIYEGTGPGKKYIGYYGYEKDAGVRGTTRLTSTARYALAEAIRTGMSPSQQKVEEQRKREAHQEMLRQQQLQQQAAETAAKLKAEQQLQKQASESALAKIGKGLLDQLGYDTSQKILDDLNLMSKIQKAYGSAKKAQENTKAISAYVDSQENQRKSAHVQYFDYNYYDDYGDMNYIHFEGENGYDNYNQQNLLPVDYAYDQGLIFGVDAMIIMIVAMLMVVICGFIFGVITGFGAGFIYDRNKLKQVDRRNNEIEIE